MLETFRIENFKGISDLTLPLKRINLLVGPNNAGKSSVLQALQFAVSVAQSAGLEGAAWTDDRLPSTLSAQQLVYSPLRDVHALAAGGRLRQDIEKAIKLTLTANDGASCLVSVRRGKNRNISVALDGRKLGERLQDLETPFSVFVPGLAGIPAYEEFRSAGVVRRAAARGDANSVFRNVLWLLHEDGEAWKQFLVDLQQIFVGAEVDLSFDARIEEHITAVAKLGDAQLPIDASGTGLLQAMQILAYVNVYRPQVLILDEPDAHLHPDNQRKLARLLSHMTEARAFQVLLSTHSRHFLDEFARTGAKIHWLTQGVLNPVENVDRVQILLDLGALDSGDRLRNGATPCVVLTEDEDPAPLRCLLESSGLTSDDVDVWSYKGCTKLDTALTLIAFIKDHAPATRILIHRDRDYHSEETCRLFTESIEKLGVSVFLTDGVDAEAHMLNAAHISRVVPELTEAEAQDIVREATIATAARSIECFTNALVEKAHRDRNKSGGASINYGHIAASAREQYEASPDRFRHGKSVERAVRASIQARIHRNVTLIKPSPWIAPSHLKAFAASAGKTPPA